MATGMFLIFQVGERGQMVVPPADFPKCGNFKDLIYPTTLSG